MTINPPANSNELSDRVVDAIAACWIVSRKASDKLGLDTFQILLETVANVVAVSPTGPSASAEAVQDWYDFDMWDLMRSRFGAVEYPTGFIMFALDSKNVALQMRDSLAVVFPGMVKEIEKTLPDLP